jgi:subtilisin family serine protease
MGRLCTQHLPFVVALLVPFSATAAPNWVVFRDRGIPTDRLDAALEARALDLSPRALARRQQHRGDRGVDARDLAPNADYIDAVLATGARLRATSRWLNAVSVDATPEQLDAIRVLSFVGRVAPVARRLRLPVAPTIGLKQGYGNAEQQLTQMGVPFLHQCGLTGEGVVVGILDTGFAVDHVAFNHLDILAQHDFVNDDDVVANEAGDPTGQDSHGTKVLSLVAGLDDGNFSGAAPDVTVILAKVDYLPTDEPIEDDWWVAGIEWVEGLGADIATNSLGFCSTCGPEVMDGATEAVTIASSVALANGLIITTSAGNGGPGATSINAPADTDGIIAVGGVDASNQVVWDSSRGPSYDGRIKPDVCAPGQAVVSVRPGTTTSYESGNGTSFATPLVAGLVALLKQGTPSLGPTEMLALLKTTSSNAGSPDNDCGWGVVSGVAAAPDFCSCTDGDGDSHLDATCGGDDCDDSDAAQHPGAEEVCDNAEDDDCDSQVDEDCSADGDGPPGGEVDGGCAAVDATWGIAVGLLLLLRRRLTR